MYMVNEKTTALTMYEQGNLDFMDNPQHPDSRKAALRQTAGIQTRAAVARRILWFRHRPKPFDNPKLRKAFALAIDRDIFPKILQGGKTPATSWIPPGMLAHNPKIGLHFNPNEARRLLREAGYPDGKGCRPWCWDTTLKKITNSSPKRCRHVAKAI